VSVIKYSGPWTKAEDAILVSHGRALAMQTLLRRLPGRAAPEIRFRQEVIHRRIVAARKAARDKSAAKPRAKAKPPKPNAWEKMGVLFSDNVPEVERLGIVLWPWRDTHV
jgi:hypothetical protein